MDAGHGFEQLRKQPRLRWTLVTDGYLPRRQRNVMNTNLLGTTKRHPKYPSVFQ